MNKILLITVILLLLILSSVLIIYFNYDPDNNDDENYVIIHINFKPNTNLTYTTFIRDKYNFTNCFGYLNSTGMINSCGFFIYEENADEIVKKMEKEENVDYIKTYNYRIIIVSFIPNTNVSAISYIENKYDIIPGGVSRKSDGSLSECDYIINEQKATKLIENIEKEEIVNYVDYRDVIG